MKLLSKIKLPTKMTTELTPKLSKIMGCTLILTSLLLLGVAFPQIFLFIMICVIGGVGIIYLDWAHQKKIEEGLKK